MEKTNNTQKKKRRMKERGGESRFESGGRGLDEGTHGARFFDREVNFAGVRRPPAFLIGVFELTLMGMEGEHLEFPELLEPISPLLFGAK